MLAQFPFTRRGAQLASLLLSILLAGCAGAATPEVPFKEPMIARNTDGLDSELYTVFAVTLTASSNCLMPGDTLHTELAITNRTTQTLEFDPPLTILWDVQPTFLNSSNNGNYGQPKFYWADQLATPPEIQRLDAGATLIYPWDWEVPDIQPDKQVFALTRWSMYAGLDRAAAANPQPAIINEHLATVMLYIPYLTFQTNDGAYPCTELRQQ